MLSDWERRRLAEIERGLAQDAPSRRARRRLGGIGPFTLASVLLALACVAALAAAGVRYAALAPAVLYALAVMTSRARRRDRHRR
ncbi:hypothetical protein KGA66_09870 [Actinocrinis puniceicyclus]|uniref:DUF3040 domain-containing protein n=1 Tax=Actinocrinis puniceicyclus TaxID=977794 RepID=A0A8J8BAV3_9ACTN|nr:hypothetical protein [Actinocrinis puniceicyclus]MBS2963352.1 hypothetical protein [Actinocrinis puniceicyclus]